ncbi:MAG TPA: hypothetical protein VK468_08485, partial [Pyrinomonadaceae bacterium]|nr:hypothetical protein [Pyrinomonadaceae bacterium]
MDQENSAIQAIGATAPADRPRVGGIRSGLTAASISIAAAGFAVVIWAGISGNFYTEVNGLSSKIFLPAAIGASLVLIGATITTLWRGVGFWLGVAVVGQAVSLQMIDAGRLIHFQHYRSLGDLASRDSISLAVFTLQILLVTIGIAKKAGAIRKWIKTAVSWWQLAAIAVVVVLSGAAVTKEVSVYAASIIVSAVVQLAGAANIVLAAWAIPDGSAAWLREKFGVLFGSDAEAESVGLDRFSVVAAVLVIVITGMLSYFVYQAHPHVPDETQYVFQARYLAAGELTVTPPLVPEAFTMYLIPYQDSRWFSIFSPGWSAVLAIGVWANAIWLVNPILAGLCVLLTYLFFHGLYSQRFARMGILLLCCSPWFIFMSMSLMSHVFTLACALGAAVLIQ